MKENNKHEITEEKLRRTDYFRVQVQLKDRVDKIINSVVTPFLSENYSKNLKTVRDNQGKQIVDDSIREVKSMENSNPKVKPQLLNHIYQNIHDEKLRWEAIAIFRKRGII